MHEKICLFCKYFYMRAAVEDWSEVTPGSGFEMECLKRHWVVDIYDTTAAEYRETMLTAQSCDDFVEVTDAAGHDGQPEEERK